MALSPDMRGLTSYGEVMMAVNNTDYLRLRASLLERNTYMFYDEHDLGARKAKIPIGFRSDWNGRSLLAVAKLQKMINRSSTLDDLLRAFLLVTEDREKDEFIEVHVFAPGGIARKFFSSVKLQKSLTNEDDQDRWLLVQKSGNKVGVPVSGYRT
jgi:hypothetical protein